jgi:PAS domain S-box-containing protein
VAGGFNILLAAGVAAAGVRAVQRHRLRADQQAEQAKAAGARAADAAVRAAQDELTRVEQAKTDDAFAAAGALARERKQTEQSEKRRKAMSLQLDTAVNNMSQGLVMFDAAARLIVCNDRYMEMYGLSREIARPGVTLLEIVRRRRQVGSFDGDPDTYCRDVKSMIARSKAFAETLETADGRTIAVVVREMADHGWVATHEDVTTERRAERELDRAQKFLLSVIENVPTSVVVKDARELRYILVNRATERFYGLPRAEIMGRTSHDLFPAASADLIVAHDRQLLESRQELVVGEHVIETPGNGRRRVVARRLPVCDDKGEPKYLLSLIDDLTERGAPA